MKYKKYDIIINKKYFWIYDMVMIWIGGEQIREIQSGKRLFCS